MVRGVSVGTTVSPSLSPIRASPLRSSENLIKPYIAATCSSAGSLPLLVRWGKLRASGSAARDIRFYKVFGPSGAVLRHLAAGKAHWSLRAGLVHRRPGITQNRRSAHFATHAGDDHRRRHG